MAQKEYENWVKIGVKEFRANLAEIIQSMEDTGLGIIVTKHGKPILQVKPISVKAIKNALTNLKTLRAKLLRQRDANPEEIATLDILIKRIDAKIDEVKSDDLIREELAHDFRKLFQRAIPTLKKQLTDALSPDENDYTGSGEAKKILSDSAGSPPKKAEGRRRRNKKT